MVTADKAAGVQRLIALAKQSAAPKLTETELDHRFGPRSSWVPVAGQLWRAVRDDITMLVVLTAVEEDSVLVVPASVDGDQGYVAADVLVVKDTAMGLPLTVWVMLPCSLPMAVLDRPVDELGQAVLSRVAERADTKPSNAAPPRDEFRAELIDELTLLAETAVQEAPIPAGASGVPLEVNLDTLDPETLDRIATRLGASLPVVLNLIDGKRPPTPAEADVLSEVLGVVPRTDPPPPGLVTELAQPRWRGVIRQYRHQRGLTESAARAAVSYDVGLMAARQTGEREPLWPDRIRVWAQGQHLDPDVNA